MQIGKMKPVDVTKLFPHEAHDFTPWLKENIDALSERLGITLTALETEKQVGSFNLDLLAEGQNGEMVIIENQLYRTDHDHLGKVLTYLVNLESKTAIWITGIVRDEHKQVFEWLNNNTPSDVRFYLVQVVAFAIGEDTFAPWFNVVVSPSETGKAAGDTTKELAARHLKRKEFWDGLLGRSKARTPLFENRSGSYDNWLSVNAGKKGFYLQYVITMDQAMIKLYIDPWEATGDESTNAEAYRLLLQQKAEIEADFGEPLEWKEKEGVRARIIMKTLNHGGLNDKEKWPKIQEAMVDAMVRFDKALRSRVRDLKI